MKKVFLDTNIIFTYIYTYPKESLSSYIFYLEEKKKIKIFISEIVKRELWKNIKIKIGNKINIFHDIITRVIILKDVTFQQNFDNNLLKSLPENDRIILATAIFHKIDYFITGIVKDFKKLYLKQIINTTILNQRDFIRLFLK